MYPTIAHSHQDLQYSSQQQQPYPYHPTPPYYDHTEVSRECAKDVASQQHHHHNLKYLATPSNSAPRYNQPAIFSESVHLPSQPQPQQQQQQHYYDQSHHSQQLQSPRPLVIDTKIVAPSAQAPNSLSMQPSPLSSRKQQQQTISQLADFAAHMVCYLLYGQPASRPHGRSVNPGVGTPPSSIPSSPLTSQGGQKAPACPCETCSQMDVYPESRPAPSSVYPSWPQQPSLGRPTHRRVTSESDIVQPKPMFRKFCLDVLSATLLSPSVILLSLKYIQQLMINLKESNKIVNTGDGAEYRFFTGALILANKFLDDNTFTNKTWADITGMKIKDVNHLEMQFLNGIDFRLFTSPAHYSEWLANLTQFTGAYMPSQHLVACQQQTSAAQSPISPMEDTGLTVGMPSATARQLAPSGAGIYSIQPSAPTALSMASISSYIDSVKHLQQKPFSGGRYQRNPTSSHHHPTQLPLSSVCKPPQQQYMAIQQQSVGGVSYNRQSTSFSSSPSTLTYGHHQRLPEPTQRKRSAIIAFDDTLDHSPRSESVLLPHAARTPVAIPTHKRYSSSSSMSTLMGFNSAQDMLHDDQSPMLQPHQRNHHRHQRSMELSHRSSSGALSTSFRGQHQRSASGSYFMNGSGTATSSCRDRCQVALSAPNSFKQSGAVHPLEEIHGQCCHQESRSATFTTSQSMQTVHPLDAHSSAPRYPIDKNMSPCHSMGCGASSSPCTTFEMDPRLWGPLDSLSLYAITTQAAKRVVAQGKALSASAIGLHMFYPTTLA
ncbi:hypothetical protein BGZ75_003390 [Mortierella antarctica]|nr:hypothetical protein BGZ75_003390 [Mortierella antarctica]